MTERNYRWINVYFGEVLIARKYSDDDSIWQLPELKRERKAIADIQRELAIEADRRTSEEPYQTRG